METTTEESPRDAFLKQDGDLSKQLHIKKIEADDPHHQESHSAIGELLTSIVFGGLDGIMTTFSIAAACVGGKLTFGQLLIVGVSNLIADGFAMGLGDFFSSTSESKLAKKLYNRYLHQIDKDEDAVKKKMRNIYEAKGFTMEESKIIVESLAHNKNTFANVMLLELDGISMEESTIWGPIKGGVVTFFSFLIFGAIPIFPFLIPFNHFNKEISQTSYQFFISLGLSAFALFILGFLKNFLVNKNPFVGGFFVLVQGGIANLASFGIGYLFDEVISKHLN